MIISNLLCFVTSISVLILGIYIFILPDRKKVQKHFLYLSGCFSVWILFFVIRQNVNYEYRHYAFDWMLIPTIFFPIFLDRIISLISNPEHKIPKWKIGILFLVVIYFLWAAFTCSFSILIDHKDFKYIPTIHYHILIIYQTSFASFSIFKLAKHIFKYTGPQRVRFTLMAFGIINILSFAIIFLYILPLLGIFYGPMSSIGALISVILWAIAILQYNAFEIKYAMFARKPVPMLNRISLSFFLLLFKILDPTEFRKSNFLYKRFLSIRILYTDIQLREKTDLDFFQRAEAVARRYERFIN
ncbi:LIC10906 family membrane protein [Leptospira interrogans]|uniref:LIC10906 family membrane protein n=1 Tax=Leptospira interrogans TaxID=173 RepID=UPI0002BE963C|nr:histidine kinase N-terminal 7TM domain-containing protein [Leptospira interrogans]EMN68636.1 putative membrane protein [Leptospira interrogans serovar Grippotyphosa str. UI 08434]EMO96506.1 putative membrane protein [Leptospira interrogans str. UI 13372]